MDSINITVDLASEVGISGARTYFKGVKQIDGKSFDKLWRVMTEANYWSYVKNKQHEWWKEDKAITDEELKIL